MQKLLYLLLAGAMSSSCSPPLSVVVFVASERLLILLVEQQVLRELRGDFPRHLVSLVVPVVVALCLIIQTLLPHRRWLCMPSTLNHYALKHKFLKAQKTKLEWQNFIRAHNSAPPKFN